MKVIGLTGAVGCGKSTVLNIFIQLGWNAVDADAICASLHADPESGIHPILAKRWGMKIIAPDGTTNKTMVASIVFGDDTERKWLESVLHPFLRIRAKEQMDSFGENANVMFDVPLLFECGWERNFKKTIAVWTPPCIQMERLIARGWNREHALFRIQSQLSADEKLEKADYGIINNSTLKLLHEQCLRLHHCLNS